MHFSPLVRALILLVSALLSGCAPMSGSAGFEAPTPPSFCDYSGESTALVVDVTASELAAIAARVENGRPAGLKLTTVDGFRRLEFVTTCELPGRMQFTKIGALERYCSVSDAARAKVTVPFMTPSVATLLASSNGSVEYDLTIRGSYFYVDEA